MTDINFSNAIRKVVDAPEDKIFESAMEMFASINQMDEHTVVALWRSLRMFWELNPGRNTSPSPVVRHLLEAAWARMIFIRDFGSMGDTCVAINLIFSQYADRNAA
jgi:hypothetical protein